MPYPVGIICPCRGGGAKGGTQAIVGGCMGRQELLELCTGVVCVLLLSCVCCVQWLGSFPLHLSVRLRLRGL